MAGIKHPPRKKEREIIASYKNIPLPDLRAVIERIGNRYVAEYPIYDGKDRLMLGKGETISEERFGKLQKSNIKHMKIHHNEPEYYFQRRTP